jgi:hypothetical protein
LTGPNSAGSYIVTVNTTDNADNNASTTKAFTVTISTPTISPNVANNTYVANQSTVTFTIGGASSTYYNTSGIPQFSTPSSAENSISVTINANTSTTFVVQVHANKSDANTTNATFSYKVDGVVPPIAFSGLTNNQRVNSTTTIRALSNDVDSGTATVTFYIGIPGYTLTNKTTDTTSPYTYDWNTLGSYTNRNYTINITAVDNVGNVNSTIINVTVNNSFSPFTQSVSSGMVDFAGTNLENNVPQISGLNSSTAVVVASNGAEPLISGGTVATDSLSETKLYLNITADTGYEARVYFKLATDQITYGDTTNIGVYADHNDDGDYTDSGEGLLTTTYVNQVDDYYNFYFTTTSFSIFAIGIKAPTVTVSGGAGGGGGASHAYPISFTSTPTKTGLEAGDKALFSFNKVTQSIEATKITLDHATFKILPSSQTVTLKKGQSKDIDLDGDGTKDMRLTLEYVYGTRKAFILVKNISTAKKATAFEIIDMIKDFYAGVQTYTAFEIIDIIRAYYGGS